MTALEGQKVRGPTYIFTFSTMSFMGGSACAAGVNPLAQMAKQQSVDRTHQFEQMQGKQGPASLRGDNRQMSAADRQLLQGMEQYQGSPGGFQYADMRNELGKLGSQPGPGPSAEWSKDFNSQFNAAPTNSQWAKEFSPGQQNAQFSAGPSHTTATASPRMGYMPSMMGGAMGGMGMMRPMGMQPQMQATQSRVVELDDHKWEEQFKNIESQSTKSTPQPEVTAEESKAQQEQEPEEEVSVEDILEEKEIGIEDGYEESWFRDNDQVYPPGWDDVWDRIKHQVGDTMAEGGRTRAGDFTSDFDIYAGSNPNFADYEFAQENQYEQEEDPFALGVALMDQGAKLSLAILCFEAALKRDANHIEAWSRLGSALAQNESEEGAIRALEQCVKLDPTNEQALMNLAVSYTNEGYENAAYATMERWLATKYPDLVAQFDKTANWDQVLHSKVTEMFIKAAQLSPDIASMDVDVQAGLGVLFYGNEEYDKAIDCFRAAISARPNDPLLWNRLGATLANSNHSEEAIEAYYKALELRPSFVRARYNVAVSCINIGCYREAVEHLLSALSLHETGTDSAVNSKNLHETLRRVFLAMDRRDLLSKVGPGMDLNAFRNEFNF